MGGCGYVFNSLVNQTVFFRNAHIRRERGRKKEGLVVKPARVFDVKVSATRMQSAYPRNRRYQDERSNRAVATPCQYTNKRTVTLNKPFRAFVAQSDWL